MSIGGRAPFPRRKLVQEKVKERDITERKKWRASKRIKSDWLVAAKDQWGQAGYVQRVTRSDRQLLAAVRLQKTRAGRSEGKEDTILKCRFCGKGDDETIVHLVLGCPHWKGE